MIIDFHSHILPKMDDGSSSVDESLAMLRMEAAQGISKVVLTPHFYPQQDSPERFLERRQAAFAQLLKAMEGEAGLPEVHLGAEVYFYPGMSQSDALSQLTIGKNGYILLEMPHTPWTESMFREIEAIKIRQGITPIIAHIDRYISPFRTFHIPERLEELPVLVQANAGFFLHRSTARLALRMIKKGQIHLLGSDCHNMTTRLPNLSEAITLIKGRLGDAVLEQICDYEDEVLR